MLWIQHGRTMERRAAPARRTVLEGFLERFFREWEGADLGGPESG